MKGKGERETLAFLFAIFVSSEAVMSLKRQWANQLWNDFFISSDTASENESRRRLNDFSWCGRHEQKVGKRETTLHADERESWMNFAVEFYALQWAVTRLAEFIFYNPPFSYQTMLCMWKSFSFPYSTSFALWSNLKNTRESLCRVSAS